MRLPIYGAPHRLTVTENFVVIEHGPACENQHGGVDCDVAMYEAFDGADSYFVPKDDQAPSFLGFDRFRLRPGQYWVRAWEAEYLNPHGWTELDGGITLIYPEEAECLD
ncbi:hypothetical protein [Actinocorallia libanotica]|uniref:Uncharacterized protein n=1 Tax=Actinocorallia libanotica TaxID=46162 RepID=A0ABP4CEU5_9ACTN